MYCSACGREVGQESRFCAACGAELPSPSRQPVPAERHARGRPIAGIAVASVLGAVDLLWSCAQLFSSLSANPAGVQAALFATFPGLQGLQFLTTSASMIGNAAVLIGALMTFLFHPSGPQVVRVASWGMLVMIALGTVLTGLLMLNSAAWPSLDTPTKGGLLGGIAGGAIGGALPYALILFLFRKAGVVVT